MKRINILESRVFNRIAAGEVVERPASVIKELVENSIDAGAKNITIEIEGGGISKISVSDNGCGILFDDLVSAFLPHATSKVRDVEDLDSIKTLGFRGEALASIGAVSEVVLISKTADSNFGGRIEIAGGNIGKPLQYGSADGTYITVSNLFFNIPARAKFLKKPKSEETQITDIISRFILANPDICFKYIVEGKQVYLSTGRGREDALFAVYGKEGTQGSLALNYDFGDIKISGFIGKPTFSKPNKTYQTLIINGRYVVNSTVAAAVFNAYGDFLMKRQYPFFVLYLDLDFESVDVNVHPNKLDVRFENGNRIYSKIFEAINRTLFDITPIVSYESNLSEQKIEHKSKPSLSHVSNSETEKTDFVSDEKSDAIRNNLINAENTKPESLDSEESLRVREIFSTMSTLSNGKNELHNSVSFGSKLFEELSNKYDSSQQSIDIVDTPKIVGSVFDTYLIVEYKGSMILVDQHAAHERILYDKFMAEIEKKAVAKQDLLIPYILKINHVESEFLETKLNLLSQLGFDVEPFGNLSFKVSSIPFVFGEINIKTFFDEFLSNIKIAKTISKTEIIKEQIAQHACKSAVKGGDSLSKNEITKLLSNISKEKIVLLCPHGRPVAIQVTKSEIEKWFKRIV